MLRVAAKTVQLAVAYAAMSLIPAAASAATASAVMAVSATVPTACVITALPLVFGAYTGATLDSSTTLSVLCTLTTPYNVALDAGVGAGATAAVRKMSNGTSLLGYTLSSDAARTINIGATIGADTLAGVGLGVLQLVTVYGRVPANQAVSPGLYTDVITATITY